MSNTNYSEDKGQRKLEVNPELDLSLQAFNLINEEVYEELNIRKRITALVQPKKNISEITSNLNPESIFILNDIKDLCIKNRLRFIHPRHFKADFPNEAILKIKKLEKENELELSRFKMLASKKTFTKKNSDQLKMLFVEIDDDVFYLLHKWGKPLSKSRKTKFYPFRNLKTFLLSVLTLAFIVAVSFPFSTAETIPDQIYLRFSVFMMMTILSIGILFFIGFTFRFSFSEQDWINEKHLN